MSWRNLIIIVICLTAAAAGILLYFHQTPVQSNAGFQWEPGCCMSYDFQMDTRAEYGRPKDEPSDYRLEITAVLNMHVLDVGESISIAMQLSDVQAVSYHQPSVYLQQVYGLPFVLTLQKNGLFREYHLPELLDREGRKRLRQLISYFEVMLPSHQRNVYVARQHDVNGEYLAYYRRETSHIVKEKRHYIQTHKTNTVTLPEITSSICRFTPAIHGCWIETLEGKESMVADFEFSDAAYSSSSVTALTLKRRETPADADEFRQLATPAEVLARADALLAAQQRHQQEETKRRLQAMLNQTPKTLAGLLQGLTRGEADIRLLTYYLQQHPKAMQTLQQLIVDGSIAADSMSEVLALLGRIGSQKAQAILTGLWQNASLPETLRRQALYSLTYMDHPVDDESFNALLSVLDDTGTDAGTDLHTMPILISGILINNARQHDPDAAQHLNRQLCDTLSSVTDEARQSLLLVALGNARQPVNIDVIIPWLQSDSLSAREAAVHAAANYPAPEMADALADQLEKEQAGPINTALLKSLKPQPLSVAHLHAIGRKLLQSEDSEVRAAAIEVLGEHKSLAPDIATDYIRQAYAGESSRENIKRMYKFMSE